MGRGECQRGFLLQGRYLAEKARGIYIPIRRVSSFYIDTLSKEEVKRRHGIVVSDPEDDEWLAKLIIKFRNEGRGTIYVTAFDAAPDAINKARETGISFGILSYADKGGWWSLEKVPARKKPSTQLTSEPQTSAVAVSLEQKIEGVRGQGSPDGTEVELN